MRETLLRASHERNDRLPPEGAALFQASNHKHVVALSSFA